MTLGSIGVHLPWSMIIQEKIPDSSSLLRVKGVLPVAVITDVCSLVFCMPEIDNLTRIAVTQDLSLRLPGNKACMANFGIRRNVELEHVVTNLLKTRENAKSQSRLALIFGALVYRILQEKMLAVYQQFSEDQDQMLAVQNAYLLTALTGTSDFPNAENMEQMIRELGPRSAERIHTFIADLDDASGWLKRMVDYRVSYTKSASEYARLFTSSNPALQKKYVTAVNLHDPADPILQHTKRFQMSARVLPQEIMDSVNGDNESIYGQVVAAGVGEVLTVDKFIQGEISSL